MDKTDPYLEKALQMCAIVSVSVCCIAVLLVVATEWLPFDAAMPLKELLTGLKSFNPLSFATFGVLIVIASPFVWVAAAIVSFATSKKVFHSLLSALVLLLMLVSIVVASR